MPIITADFVSRLSGGAANAVGNASLGGAKSNTLKPTTTDGLPANAGTLANIAPALAAQLRPIVWSVCVNDPRTGLQ